MSRLSLVFFLGVAESQLCSDSTPEGPDPSSGLKSQFCFWAQDFRAREADLRWHDGGPPGGSEVDRRVVHLRWSKKPVHLDHEVERVRWHDGGPPGGFGMRATSGRG
jgi:hypothetical protein